MRRFAVVLCLLAPACSSTSPDAPSPVVNNPVITNADLTFCVSDLNTYRARVGLSPLTMTETLNNYAAQGAQADGSANAPHSHFAATSGVARAENELLNQGFGSVREAISALDSISWSEGPSGGHYRNMTGAYTQIGCGAFLHNGFVTVVEDFH